MNPGKRIAMILAAALLGLALLLVAQWNGLGTEFRLERAKPLPEVAVDLAKLVRDPPKPKAWAEYNELLARPLFNESRLPEAQQEIADSEQAAPAAPLNVQLTGVILTKDLRMAIVTNPTNAETFRVKVGQSLEGEQAAWKLVELKPRLAVFEGVGLGRQELELSVDAKGAVAPISPLALENRLPGQQAGSLTQPLSAGVAAPPPGQMISPEEQRRRTEERLKQLRDATERLQQMQNPSSQ